MRQRMYSVMEHGFQKLAPLIPKRILFVFKRYSPTVAMDYRKKVLMHLDSHAEYSRAHSCRKEPGTVAWIERYFKEGDIFYDVGANVGPYSLIAAAFLETKCNIFAIEPHPPTYAKLCANILLNRYEHCVTPISVALAAATGLQQFNWRDDEEGSSGHALGAALSQSGERFEPVAAHSVLVYSFDDFIRVFSLPEPNHLKIDVDGIEPAILAGAKKTLHNPALKTVLVEMEREDDEKTKAIILMQQSGFALRSVEEGRNYLFTRAQ